MVQIVSITCVRGVTSDAPITVERLEYDTCLVIRAQHVVNCATDAIHKSLFLVLLLSFAYVSGSSHEVKIVNKLFLAKLLQTIDRRFTYLRAKRETN